MKRFFVILSLLILAGLMVTAWLRKPTVVRNVAGEAEAGRSEKVVGERETVEPWGDPDSGSVDARKNVDRGSEKREDAAGSADANAKAPKGRHPAWDSLVAHLPEAERPTLRDDTASGWPFEIGRVIKVDEKPLGREGHFLRTQIVETGLKYRFLRLEEEILQAGHARDEFVINRTAAVANHVIAEPEIGREREFETWAARNGYDFRRRGPASPIYLVSVLMAQTSDLPEALKFLREESGVKAVDADYLSQLSTNDSYYSSLWGHHNTGQTGGIADADLDMPEAWVAAAPDGGTPVVVGVIDTGIDYRHPDLAANMWVNPGEVAGNGIDDDGNGYIDDIHGWDFLNNDFDPDDDHFHGTHVAGTIGAVGDNGQGVAGVVLNAKLMALKFLGPNGGFTSDGIEAIDYATNQGARLTNNSWGGGGFSQVLENAIQRAEAAGVLFVAAAGNSALDNDQYLSYPASYPEDIILSVAATDHRDILARFSNYGATTVDVAAPGVGIFSTFPTTATPSMSNSGLPTDYASISGTSMASPHVAGVAALLWSHQPGLSAAEVKSRIMARGNVLPDLLSKIQSGRRVNAFATVGETGPTAAELLFTKVDASFSDGNGDGAANPGETLELRPELLNIGEQSGTSVTIEAVAKSAGVTVVGATESLADIGTLQRGLPSAPLLLTVDAALTDNTRIEVDLIVRWGSGESVTETWSTVVVQDLPFTEVELDWAPGEMLADPGRQRVYVVDRTNGRLIAINTETGTVDGVIDFAGAGGGDSPDTVKAINSGHLAISQDGSLLWVALGVDRQIQAFNLPDLTPAAAFDTDFRPVSLAQSANGRLFATSTDYWGGIREINPVTGIVERTFDKGGKNGTFYYYSLLRTSDDGQRLFVSETGLRTAGGPAYVYEYDVSGSGDPPLVDRHPYWQVYMDDFEVDSAAGRIYTMNGGIYGVQVTETTSSAFGDVWDFESPYGTAVEVPTGSQVVYAASGSSIDGEVTRFDGGSSEALQRLVPGTNGTYVRRRGLALTPGGRQCVMRQSRSGGSNSQLDGYRYYFGIVGLDNLDISNLPEPELSPARLLLTSVEISDPDANRDGVAAPGETIQLLPRVRNVGRSPATNVSISCSSETAGITVQAPALASIQDIPGLGRATPLNSGFALQIDAGVADGTVVDVMFTVNHNDTETRSTSWTFTVKTNIPTGLSAIEHETLGTVIADRTQSIVYLQDRQNHRLLAINTSLGIAVDEVELAGPKKVISVFGAGPPELGEMAISTDGGTLYIAILESKTIQAISLPEFETTAAWSFDFEPLWLATDALGRIYVADEDDALWQVDGTTGAVLGRFGALDRDYDTLRSSRDGTLLYAMTEDPDKSDEVYGDHIERFDTTGSGLPSQVGIDLASGIGYKNFREFEWDETRQRSISPIQSGLEIVPLVGEPSTLVLGASHVTTVALAPDDSRIWAAVRSSTNGTIRVFNSATGDTLHDFDITDNSNADIVDGALAVTPNGRALYVLSEAPGSSNSSVDGHLYKVGIVGGGLIDLELPLEDGKTFWLESVEILDSLSDPNSEDGFPNPGETVWLSPTIKNRSLSGAHSVTVELVSISTNASIVTTGPVAIGGLASYETGTPSTQFEVQLGAGANDGEDVVATFRISQAGSDDEELDYRFTLLGEQNQEVTLSFTPGELMSDPSRNLVYLVDETNQRLMAFDTEFNRFSAAVPLAGSPGPGFMDISPDHARLYIALTDARKLQVFSLPDLTQADVVDLDFDIYSIVAGADGYIYATSTENGGAIRKVDPLTGEVIESVTNNGSTFYKESILRSNTGHNRLFVFETGLSGGSEKTPEWDISGETPPKIVDQHLYHLSNTKDIRVDEDFRRLYTASYPDHGISVTDMDSGIAEVLWPNEASFSTRAGTGVAFLPDDRFVYHLSEGAITRYIRETGERVGQYVIPTRAADRGIALTPNKRIVYMRLGGIMGAIGGPPIDASIPSVAPSNYAGAMVTLQEDNSTTLTASVLTQGDAGGLSHVWRLIDGPGTAVFSGQSDLGSTASFSAPGRYLLEIASSETGVLSGEASVARDLLVVDVDVRSPDVSVSASRENVSVPEPGELIFTRDGGDINKALEVSFSVSGTATEGVDFEALGTTVTIPQGSPSLTLPVNAIASGSVSGKTVTVTVSPNEAYRLGVSGTATVTLMDYFSFEAFQTLYFDEEAPANLVLKAADFDGDGYSNFFEYALDMNPAIPNAGELIDAGVQGFADNNSYLCITYTIPPGRAATYVVETSIELGEGEWHSGQDYVEELSRTTNAEGSVIVKACRKEPVTGGRGFIRLRINGND